MRSIKGYAMRQVRRETFRNYNRNTYSTKKKKEEFDSGEIYFGLAWIIGFIIFINIMSQI